MSASHEHPTQCKWRWGWRKNACHLCAFANSKIHLDEWKRERESERDKDSDREQSEKWKSHCRWKIFTLQVYCLIWWMLMSIQCRYKVNRIYTDQKWRIWMWTQIYFITFTWIGRCRRRQEYEFSFKHWFFFTSSSLSLSLFGFVRFNAFKMNWA